MHLMHYGLFNFSWAYIFEWYWDYMDFVTDEDCINYNLDEFTFDKRTRRPW